MYWTSLFLLSFLALTLKSQFSEAERSFTIGYDQNCFLKDGECFRYVSGSMHYFRVPRAYWKDRMLKMRAAGLNALQTYIEWRSHEPVPGVFDFSGNLDIVNYIKTAQDVGLSVILRPGPFIDAERDMGGFPSWLLKMNKTMVLRSSDSSYMFYVERYFAKLISLLKPLMYVNGGPVITVQVENEYGSYFTCDQQYLARLRSVLQEGLGSNVLLFTTDGDGDGYLKCGHVDGAYATVDFGAGADVKTAFDPQRRTEPKGPLVNSEYYPGWLDHWGQPHANVDGSGVAKTLDDMLAFGASVNIYMMHGGTSFGYSAGSNQDGASLDFCPTSYDYDAPISEAGDLTDKFMKIRDVVGKYLPLPSGDLPKNSTKIAFGPIQLKRQYPVIPLVDHVSPIKNQHPLTFEELGLDSGFVYYEAKVDFMTTDPVLLNITGIRDRGYVFVDRVFQGILSRGRNIFTMPVSIQPGQNLSIFVENQGRICYGSNINDFKGILGDVYLGAKQLLNWNMWPMTFIPEHNYSSAISIDNPQKGKLSEQDATYPTIREGIFSLPKGIAPSDTFLRMDGWFKGMVGINGFNLGRYWPVMGPQVTLYVPGVLLKAYPENNQITVLELEKSPCEASKAGCTVNFVKEHVVNGPVPN